MCHQPLNSDIVSRVKMRQTTPQFGLWVAAADDVKHCLMFATLSLAARPHVLWQDAQ